MTQPTAGIFALPADCSIGAAQSLHEELLQRVQQSALLLDASAVSRIDAAGLQLLVAACNSEVAETPPRLHNPSDALIGAAHQAGLTAALGLAGLSC